MRENSLNPAILIPNPSHACSAHSASITFRKSENSSLLWVLKDIGQLDRFIPRKPAVVKPAEKLESETIISVHRIRGRPSISQCTPGQSSNALVLGSDVHFSSHSLRNLASAFSSAWNSLISLPMLTGCMLWILMHGNLIEAPKLRHQETSM